MYYIATYSNGRGYFLYTLLDLEWLTRLPDGKA
jgi:hypothetical protein